MRGGALEKEQEPAIEIPPAAVELAAVGRGARRDAIGGADELAVAAIAAAIIAALALMVGEVLVARVVERDAREPAALVSVPAYEVGRIAEAVAVGEAPPRVLLVLPPCRARGLREDLGTNPKVFYVGL